VQGCGYTGLETAKVIGSLVADPASFPCRRGQGSVARAGENHSPQDFSAPGARFLYGGNRRSRDGAFSLWGEPKSQLTSGGASWAFRLLVCGFL